MKKVVILAAIAAGIFLVVCGGFRGEPWVQAAQSGNAGPRSPAADFRITDLNGKPLHLSALRGKVVLLDFWATWCSPCREELPHFKELYAAYKGKGLEMIGLSVGESPETVRSFVQSNGIPYPVAISPSQVVQDYGGIRGIPTTFLIDKKGRIAKKYVGLQEKQVFEREIQSLLAE